MNEYITTDIRDLDSLPLGKVHGSHYYEQRLVLRIAPDGTRAIVGKASDWPLIKLQAENAELTMLLVVSEERSIDADCHVSELVGRISCYERHIAALEQALAETQPPPQIAPAEAESAEAAFVQVAAPVLRDGKVSCDHPGCDARVKPRGLPTHKRQAHGVAGLIGHKGKTPDPSLDERRKCPHCTARPKMEGMRAHIERKHPEQITVVAAPTPAHILEALSLGERPWRCANPACSGAWPSRICASAVSSS